MHLQRPLRVGVMSENAPAGAARNFPRARRGQSIEMHCNLLPVCRDQHFTIRLEKKIDALPAVGDQACASPYSLKHPSGWREPVAGHALAVDVQGREAGAEERVVIVSADVANALDIDGNLLGFPS